MILRVKISIPLIESFLTTGNKFKAGLVKKGIPKGSRLFNARLIGLFTDKSCRTEGLDVLVLFFETKGQIGEMKDIGILVEQKKA